MSAPTVRNPPATTRKPFSARDLKPRERELEKQRELEHVSRRLEVYQQRLVQAERELQDRCSQAQLRVDMKKAHVEEGVIFLQRSHAQLHRVEWELRQLHHNGHEMEVTKKKLEGQLTAATRKDARDREAMLLKADEAMALHGEKLAKTERSAEKALELVAAAASEFKLRLEILRREEYRLKEHMAHAKRCQKDLLTSAHFRREVAAFLQPLPEWRAEQTLKHRSPEIEGSLRELEAFEGGVVEFLKSLYSREKETVKQQQSGGISKRHFAILRKLRQLPDLCNITIAATSGGGSVVGNEVLDPVTGKRASFTKTQVQEAERLRFACRLRLSKLGRRLLKERKDLRQWGTMEELEDDVRNAEHRVWLGVDTLRERKHLLWESSRTWNETVGVPLSLFDDCPRGTPPYHSLMWRTNRRSLRTALVRSASEEAMASASPGQKMAAEEEPFVFSLVHAYHLKNKTTLTPEVLERRQLLQRTAKRELEEALDALHRDTKILLQSYQVLKDTRDVARIEAKKEEEKEEKKREERLWREMQEANLDMLDE